MDKRTRQNLVVGLVAILSFAALVVVLLWLRNALTFWRNKHYTVVFQDAKGLSDGSFIQMSGVTVGKVDEVKLTRNFRNFPDNLAQVEISITPGHHVPDNSRFLIRSSIIGNTPSLVVEPNPAKGVPDMPDRKAVLGESTPGMEQIVAESEPLLKKVDKLTDSVTRLTESVTTVTQDLGDAETRGELKRTVRNIAVTTDQLPALLRQTQGELNAMSGQTHTILNTINRAAVNGQQVAQNAAGLTDDLRAALNENRAGIRNLIRNADDTTASLAQLTQGVAATVGNKSIQRSLTTATENLAAITAKLNATADDLNRIASDPATAANIHDTVATFRETADNLKATSVSIRNIAARVETIHIPGERRRSATPAPGPASSGSVRRSSSVSLLEPGLVFDSLYDTKVSRLRVDTDFTLLTGSQGGFYRLGLYDMTYGNRLNLEAGTAFGSPTFADWRYGIIAGKLGTGIDLRGGLLDFRLDGYDPNRLTLDARARANISADTSILVGVESLNRKRDSRATVGIQIRK